MRKQGIALGLDGIYSLVSTDDLADTGYTSKVRLNIQIDDLTQIKGKTIRIKNGSKIVKEVTVSSGEIQLELPVGIYELEMPLPKTTAYQYDNEYLIASAGNVSKQSPIPDKPEIRWQTICRSRCLALGMHP